MKKQPKRIEVQSRAFAMLIDGVRIHVRYTRNAWSGEGPYIELRADAVKRKGRTRWTLPRTMRIRPTRLAEWLGAAIDREHAALAAVVTKSKKERKTR